MSHLLRLTEIVLLPIAWGTILWAALQAKHLASASAHSVCGPWGCGPETSALVAMHAGWLAAIGPPLIYFPYRLKLQRGGVRRLSLGLLAMGMTGIFAIVAWQWLVWLPQAGSWSKEYIWQRCGFAIVTAVDLPLIQLLILSGILWIVSIILPTATTDVPAVDRQSFESSLE